LLSLLGLARLLSGPVGISGQFTADSGLANAGLLGDLLGLSLLVKRLNEVPLSWPGRRCGQGL